MTIILKIMSLVLGAALDCKLNHINKLNNTVVDAEPQTALQPMTTQTCNNFGLSFTVLMFT